MTNNDSNSDSSPAKDADFVNNDRATSFDNNEESHVMGSSYDIPLRTDRVAKHLGYPPPPEFESLPDDFYKDLPTGYPAIEGKSSETTIDTEIYCFYLKYFVKYPILLYVSAYSRESERFSRKVSWDVYEKYGRVFYGFINPARMRKTLLQKLNRYRKKNTKTDNKNPENGESNISNNGANSSGNNENISNGEEKSRRNSPVRKTERGLMDQILKLHDRIIDTAINSGASKRPHKNSKTEIGANKESIYPTTETTSDSNMKREEDGDEYHSEGSSSGSSEKAQESPRASAVSTDPTSVVSTTTLPTLAATEGSTSQVTPPSYGTSEEAKKFEASAISRTEAYISRKRSWTAINDGGLKNNNRDKEPTIQKLLNGSIPGPIGSSKSAKISHPGTKKAASSFPSTQSPNSKTMNEILEFMNELKKRDVEASVALDSINTDVQMLADQIDYIRHNLEMTIEMTKKRREHHNQICTKMMNLLKNKEFSDSENPES